MAIRAAIYCRLSWAPDGSEENVDRQESDGRALADRLGWHVERVYKDNSQSAWKRNRKRKGWDSMLRAVENKELDAIVVTIGDRLVRQPWDLELLLRLADERQLQLASVAGVRNLNSADDRFILRIEAAQACKSSDDTSRRVTRGWQSRAEKGLPAGGGKRPFGFEADKVTIREDEAKVLREAVDRLLSGHTLGGVVRWMNEVSTTSMGNPWNGRSVRNVMTSPRLAGLISRNGRTYEGAWEPIVDAETWQEVVALFRANGERYDHPAGRRGRLYLLTGIAECHTCGGGMSTKPTGGRNRKTSRIYYCRRCRNAGRNREHLEEYVVTQTLEVLNRPRFREQLASAAGADPEIGKEIAQLERRREQTKQQLETLADHPDIDPALVARSLTSFTEKIEALRAQQATATEHQLLMRAAGIDRDGWDELPIDVRAEIVRSLFRVVVYPATWRGPGFDPDSVSLTRRPLG